MEENLERYALISVYDKSGIVPFAYGLTEQGYSLLATGGSAKLLRKEGLDVLEVSEFTEEPELFQGRLKTLSPKIFGGILYNRDQEEDRKEAINAQMPPIDIVVVNFYPFVEEAVQKNLSLEEAIEFIDIGGPSLLRAAAKNWKHTIPVCSPSDYKEILLAIETNSLTDTLRQKLAAKTFRTVLEYDEAISSYFDQHLLVSDAPKKISLSYGENPGQEAFLLQTKNKEEPITHLYGKELSYNNILDLDSGIQLIKDFGEEPACAILKHTNPCGLAWGEKKLCELFEQAFSSDPVSAFGGIIITNREVDALTAKKVNESFFEGILAPSFSSEALDILKTKKNRRLLTINFEKVALLSQSKSTVLGTLHQSKYPELVKPSFWEHKAGPKLSNEDEAQLHKALLAVKHLKSNAIALTKENKAIGLAAGHVSRVDACAHAILKAKSFDHSLEGSFIASDAFFPFRDCVDMAAESRVKAICQPGGSIRDDESIEACNELGVSLYFCGQRYFKH